MGQCSVFNSGEVTIIQNSCCVTLGDSSEFITFKSRIRSDILTLMSFKHLSRFTRLLKMGSARFFGSCLWFFA